MSYGPPPLPRDAYHAERLYWRDNPPLRRPGELTVREVAAALGVTAQTVRLRAKAGKLGQVRRSQGQLFFSGKDIANVALAESMKKK